MNDLKKYLIRKVSDIILSWTKDEVYAISFFVHSNEAYKYNNYSNVTEFSISCNTERDCCGADELSEERWNYAFWCQNETPIVEADDDNEGMKILFDWYNENGIVNIGHEDFSNCYDEKMQYIGKGPIGYYEFLLEVTDVAKELQESNFIKNTFGKSIPIIIHDLDYTWYVIEATKKANSKGEAKTFLEAMKKLGVIN